MKKCSPQQIYRKGYHRRSYTTKRGSRISKTYVRGVCIKSTRAPQFRGKKRSQWSKKVQRKLRKSHEMARKLYGSQGYYRRSYRRKSYRKGSKKMKGVVVGQTIVPPKCIKSRGSPGKGPDLIGPLMKGTLTKFGYHAKDSTGKRREALTKAVEAYGWLPVFRKLNAVATLSKNTNSQISKTMRGDSRWVRATFS